MNNRPGLHQDEAVNDPVTLTGGSLAFHVTSDTRLPNTALSVSASQLTVIENQVWVSFQWL